jgi:pyridoxal phosphate enzyme (YggS family)
MSAAPAETAAIAERYRHVRARIDAAARRAQRDPASITLVAVTKSVEPAPVRCALAIGIEHLGENYVQEAAGKIPRVIAQPYDGPPPRWHLIGHLQRNKARLAVPLFDLIHTLDSEALALALDRIGAEHGRVVRTLLQVNVAGDAAKSGLGATSAPKLLERLQSLRHLRVEGLMTVPPAPHDPEQSRPHFQALAGLRQDLRSRGFDLVHLSMGMTADYEIAVEEGATLIRIGEAIFGPRPDRPHDPLGVAARA